MTVSSTTASEIFSCNGVTVAFTCPFRVLSATEMQVYLITVATGSRAPLTNGVDYTVTNAGTAANALITTVAAYGGAYQLKCKRRTSRLQETDYRDNDPFPAESHEAGLDRRAMVDQELDEDLTRAILAPDGETMDELPSAVNRADKVLTFDSAGNPKASAPASGSATALAVDLASTASAALGTGMIGFKRNYVGAVGRLLRLKLEEWISTTDFGAVHDGVTDDTVAFQSALTAANGKTLFIPAGTPLITAGFTIASNATRIVGEGKLSTNIIYRPTIGGDILFKFSAGAGILYYCGVSDLTITHVRAFDPNDYTAVQKTAIKLLDVSEFELDNVEIKFFTSTGFDSIGLHICGREFINLRNVSIQADRPYVVDTNPNHAYLVMDACTWTGVYGRSAYHAGPVYSSHPVMEAVNSSHIQHWTVNGFVMSGMYGGFYFNPTNMAAVGYGWNIVGMHYEMPLNSATGAYGFKVQQLGTPQSVFGVTITGYTSGSGANSYGILARNVIGLNIVDSVYDGTIVGLDVDSTCDLVRQDNFILPQGAATISVGTLVRTGPSRKGSYANFAVAQYVKTTSDYKDFHTVQFTRDVSLASGSQSLTGFGFKPRFVTFTAVIGGVTKSYSIGSAGDGSNQSLVGFDSAGAPVAVASVISLEVSAGNKAVATFSSSDADGITLAWVKTGAPVGTATCTLTAWR